jgi:hypothetical protein
MGISLVQFIIPFQAKDFIIVVLRLFGLKKLLGSYTILLISTGYFYCPYYSCHYLHYPFLSPTPLYPFPILSSLFYPLSLTSLQIFLSSPVGFSPPPVSRSTPSISDGFPSRQMRSMLHIHLVGNREHPPCTSSTPTEFLPTLRYPWPAGLILIHPLVYHLSPLFQILLQPTFFCAPKYPVPVAPAAFFTPSVPPPAAPPIPKSFPRSDLNVAIWSFGLLHDGILKGMSDNQGTLGFPSCASSARFSLLLSNLGDTFLARHLASMISCKKSVNGI